MVEWVFVVCLWVDPLMLPYLVRPIGTGVVAPTRDACEVGRAAVREWSRATGELYVVGHCEEVRGRSEELERQRNELSCVVPPN
jgi:hypothetical protein